MCIKPLNLTDRIVKCGQCIQCLTEKSYEWAFRVEYEGKGATSGVFVTLTYNNQNAIWVDCENGETLTTLSKRDVQLFMKKLRKANNKETTNASIPVRYFLCGEYGETLRAHYHLIIFNLEPRTIERYIAPTWDKGFVDIQKLNAKAIRYVTNYMLLKSREIQPEQQKPFTLMSRNPGIGANYIGQNFNRHFVDGDYKLNHATKHKRNLYRYYTDKTMTEEMKIEARQKKEQEYKEWIELEEKRSEKADPLDPKGFLQKEKNHKEKILKKRQKKRK